ncbi:MAG: iron-sulfur cluster repair di-iron protein [Candidatus Anammoximicrobium sp.]|nr:iron-sulfur cluster repair di-iron protein [Candidatus Anammoximicrobium sp.]
MQREERAGSVRVPGQRDSRAGVTRETVGWASGRHQVRVNPVLPVRRVVTESRFGRKGLFVTIDLQSPVGDLVKQRPSRSRVFEKLQIDYCCGGKLPLAEACERQGLDAQTVLRELRESDAQYLGDETPLVDADAMSLAELADHIEQTHHAYLKGELPRLDALTQKVLEVHGDADRRLQDVRRAFVALHQELAAHLRKEEQILFPMIRQLESAARVPAFHCGSVANPIRQMEYEHDSAGQALAILSGSTDGYQPPEWACHTYRAMLDGLKQLEGDLHQHIHKENNVLFPKAIRRESALAGEACRCGAS